MQSIPSEVLLLVSEYLAIEDFLRLQRVCKTFYSTTNQQRVWQSVCGKRWLTPKRMPTNWKLFYYQKWKFWKQFERFGVEGLVKLKQGFTLQQSEWQPQKHGLSNIKCWKHGGSDSVTLRTEKLMSVPFEDMLSILKNVEDRNAWDSDLMEATILSKIDRSTDIAFLIFNSFAEVVLIRKTETELLVDRETHRTRRRWFLSEHTPLHTTQKLEAKKSAFRESLNYPKGKPFLEPLTVTVYGSGWVVEEITDKTSLLTYFVCVFNPFRGYDEEMWNDLSVYRPHCLINLEGFYNSEYMALDE